MRLSRTLSNLILSCVFAISTLVGSLNFALADDKSSNLLFVEGGRTYVQSFPVILRLRLFGPQNITYADLLDPYVTVRVFLRSHAGKEYVIESKRISRTTVMGPNGGLQDGTLFGSTQELPAGQRRTVLLDLSSLIPSPPSRLKLSQIPAGAYEMRVALPLSGAISAPVEVNFVSTSNSEREFLTQVKKNWIAHLNEIYHREFQERGEINWALFLRNSIPLIKQDLTKLRTEALKQISLHVLYSELLSSDKSIEEFESFGPETLKTLVIPDYLLKDKQSLELEIKLLQERESEIKEQINNLLEADPGLQWRIENARDGRADFMPYMFRRRRKAE